jgi:hypothetical protein
MFIVFIVHLWAARGGKGKSSSGSDARAAGQVDRNAHKFDVRFGQDLVLPGPRRRNGPRRLPRLAHGCIQDDANCRRSRQRRLPGGHGPHQPGRLGLRRRRRRRGAAPNRLHDLADGRDERHAPPWRRSRRAKVDSAAAQTHHRHFQTQPVDLVLEALGCRLVRQWSRAPWPGGAVIAAGTELANRYVCHVTHTFRTVGHRVSGEPARPMKIPALVSATKPFWLLFAEF